MVCLPTIASVYTVILLLNYSYIEFQSESIGSLIDLLKTLGFRFYKIYRNPSSIISQVIKPNIAIYEIHE